MLFDREFYLKQNPDVPKGTDPLQHYMSRGVAEGRDPNPLFDTSFYLERNRDVATAGVNPLAHFIAYGAAEGRDPHPLFDTSFYLEQYPDVAAAGLNPLVHYLSCGAAEGRDPNPLFSTAAYVERHPESVQVGMNPLVHYLNSVSSIPAPPNEPEKNQASQPSPSRLAFSVKELSGAETRSDGPSPGPDAPTVLCISHVSPYPPRAGNEYRIFRMLRWLEARGYRIILVVSPLPGEPVSEAQVAELGRLFKNAVLCERDGRVVYSGEELGRTVRSLEAQAVKSFSKPLGEAAQPHTRAHQLLQIDRTFCNDALAQLVTAIRADFPCCAVLAEYIFMTRLLPLLPRETFKIVDTIDVFSTKQRKVVQYGISDDLAITREEEHERLVRADLVLAIQKTEHTELSEIVPERPVILAGVDFDVLSHSEAPTGRKILCVASDNPMNVKGLKDFLRFAWPLIARDVPDAELIVAGRVCGALEIADERVRLMGPVQDIAELYRRARVTINPTVAGTGLKIKTVEALSYLRPIVTWPSGIDGMDPELAKMCLCVKDWYDFYRCSVKVLTSARPEWFGPAEDRLIAGHLSPETVYAPLCEQLENYFQCLHRRAATASG